MGSTVARPVAAEQHFRAHWPLGPWLETGEWRPWLPAAAPTDSSEPEVRDWGERGRGTTSRQKESDWRSWGGRGLTDEALRGGVRRVEKSGDEGSEVSSGPELEGLQVCT
jgi:hypothetical protein